MTRTNPTPAPPLTLSFRSLAGKLNIVLEQNLLNVNERTIIFTQKKHVAAWLKKELKKAFPGTDADDIHGDKSQSQRESALRKFRAGTVQFLVATDVAARGLDVDGIEHVLQFDLPVSREDFDKYVSPAPTSTTSSAHSLLSLRSPLSFARAQLRAPHRPYGPRRQDGPRHRHLRVRVRPEGEPERSGGVGSGGGVR
jgi:hypothetical protein